MTISTGEDSNIFVQPIQTASHIAGFLAAKIEGLEGSTSSQLLVPQPSSVSSQALLPPPGTELKRGRGRPRKGDNDQRNNGGTSPAKSQKSYPCDWPHCGMWFSQSSNLNKHYLTHTNEKPFKCLWPNCNKSFKQSSNLNKHRFVHTGEKPFLCDQCHKRFSQSSNLKKHKFVHSGEKPYKCEYPGCTRVFDQSSNLNKHHMTHIGEKPFACDQCGEKFTQSSNLSKHMRKHGQFVTIPHSQLANNNNVPQTIGLNQDGSIIQLNMLPPSVSYATNGTTGGHSNHQSKLESESAVVAATNVFFNNHTSKLNFHTLDSKFVSDMSQVSQSSNSSTLPLVPAHFLQPGISLAATFTTSSVQQSSPVISCAPPSSRTPDQFSVSSTPAPSSTPTPTNSENGLDMADSPNDPNRFLSLKLSVPNSDE